MQDIRERKIPKFPILSTSKWRFLTNKQLAGCTIDFNFRLIFETGIEYGNNSMPTPLGGNHCIMIP